MAAAQFPPTTNSSSSVFFFWLFPGSALYLCDSVLLIRCAILPRAVPRLNRSDAAVESKRIVCQRTKPAADNNNNNNNNNNNKRRTKQNETQSQNDRKIATDVDRPVSTTTTKRTLVINRRHRANDFISVAPIGHSTHRKAHSSKHGVHFESMFH